MVNAKTLLTWSVAALCAISMAGGNGNKKQIEAEKARRLLLKTLERTYPQNVVAIILQRAPDCAVMQRIQVQISRDGRMRQTVLYPLSMEGVETIDDGKVNATYLPDEKLALIQESPRLQPNDSATRINLTVQNYGLKLGGTSTVAGRPAAVVVATPRSKEMETRRYYIDERTGFLLQLETISSSGQPNVAFKTQVVSYPSSLSSSVFDVKPSTKGYRSISFRRRTGLYDGGKDGLPLGFEPTLPDDLPYGFSIQDAKVTDSNQWRAVAIRITDGPVKGTVYQWPASSKIREMPGTTAGEGGGMKFAVIADVPEGVRRKILQAFIEAAREARGNSLSFVGLLGALELSLRQISLSQSELSFGLFLVAASEY